MSYIDYSHKPYIAGIKLNTGPDWASTVGAENFNEVLRRLDNGTITPETINAALDEHAAIMNSANGKWSGTKSFYDPNKKVADYQTKFRNANWNLVGIGKYYNNRYTVPNGRTSGDSPSHNYQVDNLVSSITADRHILGTSSTWTTNLVNNYNQLLKSRNLELYLDPRTNYYKLRPINGNTTSLNTLSLSPNPANYNITNPRILNPNGTNQVPNGSQNNPNNPNKLATGPDGKKLFPKYNNKFLNKNDLLRGLNSLVSPLLSGARLLNETNANNRIARTLTEAANPALHSTYRLHRNIYGDFAALAAGLRNAGKLMSEASRIANSTSNAELGAAARLDALVKANNTEEEGRVRDNAKILQDLEKAWQVNVDNIQRQNTVDNYNRDQVNEADQAKASIEANRISANNQSLNNFLLERLAKWDLNRDIRRNIGYQTDLVNAERDAVDVNNKYYKDLLATSNAMSSIQRKMVEMEDGPEKDLLLKLYDALKRKYYDSKNKLNYLYQKSQIDALNRWYGGDYLKLGGKILKGNFGLLFLKNPLFNVYLPYITEPTYPQTSINSSSSVNASAKSSGSGSSGSGGSDSILSDFEKKAFELYKSTEMLPSDASQLSKYVSSVLNQAKYSIDGGESIASLALVKLINLLNLAKFNIQEKKAAESLLKTSKGTNEVAIGHSGEVYIANNGGIQAISQLEYLKNAQVYYPYLLTNEQLLNYRSMLPGAAFDNSLIEVAKNGIGMLQVEEKLKAIISGIKDAPNTTSYIKLELGHLIEGEEWFKSLPKDRQQKLGIELNKLTGKFKITLEGGSFDTNDQASASRISSTINTIFASLPDNMLNLLLVKMARYKTEVSDFLKQLLFNYTAVLKDSITAIKETDNSESKSKSSKSKKSTPEGMEGSLEYSDDNIFNNAFAFFNEGLGDVKTLSFNTDDKNDNYLMNITALSTYLSDANKNPTGNNHTLLNVSEGLYTGYLEMSLASAAGVRMDSLYADKTLIKGSRIYMGYFPYTSDKHGAIVPRLDYTLKVSEVNKNLKLKGIDVDKLEPIYVSILTSKEYSSLEKAEKLQSIKNKMNIVNSKYLAAGLAPLFNNNGINKLYYTKFAMLDGYVLDKAFGDIDDNDKKKLKQFAHEVNKTEFENVLLRIMTLNGWKADDGNFDLDYDSWSLPFWDSHDTIYHTPIFIPVINSKTAWMAGGATVEANTIKTMKMHEALAQNTDKLRSFKGHSL